MKKIFSMFGALLLGSAAMAQANKADTAKKSGVRKVTPADVKPGPPAPQPAKSITIKQGADIKQGATIDIKAKAVNVQTKSDSAIKTGGKK